MKTIYYNIVLAMLMLPLIGFAGNDLNGRITKQKKINKSFTVSKDALLEISNSYGHVDISTWSENRIEIEVIIKTNGNDEEAVIERLREIDVDFSNSSSHVKAVTRFEKKNSSWWSNIFSGNKNVNMEINYRVKAPVTNNVDLDNDYGGISIDKLEGNAIISCDYGRLLIGELLGNNNKLSFDYTRNSQIDFMKNGKINADYSEFTLGEAVNLELSADYTDSNIKKVEHLTFNCDYGSLKVEKVRNLQGRGDYLGTRLGSLYGSAELGMDYGSLSIEKLMKSARKLDISSDYTGIRIGYDSNSSFRFSIETSYGSIKGVDGQDFSIDKRHQEIGEDFMAGFFKEDSGAQITINSSYGNITFTN